MNPRRSLLCLASTLVATLAFPGPAHADDVAEKARPLRFSSILVDTHDDTTQRFFTKGFALGERKPDGSVDIPRMREGGMDAIFFSIWIDGRTLGPPALQKALDQVAAVKENVERYPADLVFARSAEDVRSCPRAGQDRRADGRGGRPHARQRHSHGAHLRRAGRALRHPHALLQRRVGRLLD